MPKPKPANEQIRISLLSPKPVRDELKILAVKQGRTLQDLATEAFADLLNKYRAA